MSAIGCHAQHLASFVAGVNAVARCRGRPCAVPERKVVDYVSALIEFEGGARGTLHGDAGGGRRRKRHPAARLRRERACSTGRIASLRICASRCTANRCASSAGAIRPCRPRSLRRDARRAAIPKDLREAFANIYAEVAQERMARTLGEAVPARAYPTHRGGRPYDGVHRGVRRVASEGRLGRRRPLAGSLIRAASDAEGHDRGSEQQSVKRHHRERQRRA